MDVGWLVGWLDGWKTERKRSTVVFSLLFCLAGDKDKLLDTYFILYIIGFYFIRFFYRITCKFNFRKLGFLVSENYLIDVYDNLGLKLIYKGI